MIFLKNIILFNFFLILFTGLAFGKSQWFHSSGNYESQRYSNLNQITKKNISDLNKAWTFNSGKIDKKNVVQATPIFIDDKLIVVDIFGGVYALNPKNGQKIWYKKLNPPAGRRGITSYMKNKPNIYISTKNSVVELDARTGNILKEFKSGLSLLPPIITNEQIYVATLKEGIKAFDLNTADLLWNYKLNTQNVNPRVWSGFSYDKYTNSLFVVTSNPGGLYGGNRGGKDLSVSLISVNSGTGKKNWSFQHIRHDLWDFDLVGNPIIFSRKNERHVFERVVAALSKTGDIILLKVKDGSLVFPEGITKINVPNSDVKNEKTASFQYKFSKPAPFSGIKVDLKDDFKHLTKNDNIKLFKIISKGKSGDYLPPSFNYNLITYGLHGGAEWPGGSLDKKENSLIIPFNKEPWVIRMEYSDLIYARIKKISKEIYKANTKIKNSYEDLLKYFKISPNAKENNFDNKTLIQNPWETNNKYNKITNSLFSLVPFTGLDKFYKKNCSSCHGTGREGFYENEFEGDKYIPSLVGLNLKSNYKFQYSYDNLKKAHNDLQIKFDFNEQDLFDSLDNFKNYDNFLDDYNLLDIKGFWQNLLDVDGYPASNPPWGGIAKLDLNNGNLIWKIPFGYRLDKKNKKKIIGDINFGGVLSTSTSIFFATGTPDEMARAYSSENGNLIWESKLPYAGSAPPMTFFYQGCQYVVFTSTGGQFLGFKKKGDATIAYKLDTCN